MILEIVEGMLTVIGGIVVAYFVYVYLTKDNGKSLK